EVTGFFVTQPFDLLFLSQPVAPLDRISKAAQTLSQLHAAVCVKVVSRSYNVTRPSDWKTMRTCFLQSAGHGIRVAIKQQGPHGVNRIQSHAGRSTGSENAVGQLFPEPGVRSFAPNLVKLTKPFPNLPAACSVSGHNSFNFDGFLIALHCSLSILGFYERAGKLVNDMFSHRFMRISVMMVAGWPRRLKHPLTLIAHQICSFRL